jgi:hypothetical protein
MLHYRRPLSAQRQQILSFTHVPFWMRAKSDWMFDIML